MQTEIEIVRIFQTGNAITKRGKSRSRRQRGKESNGQIATGEHAGAGDDQGLFGRRDPNPDGRRGGRNRGDRQEALSL